MDLHLYKLHNAFINKEIDYVKRIIKVNIDELQVYTDIKYFDIKLIMFIFEYLETLNMKFNICLLIDNNYMKRPDLTLYLLYLSKHNYDKIYFELYFEHSILTSTLMNIAYIKNEKSHSINRV